MSCTICGKQIETVYASEHFSGYFCKDCWKSIEHAFDTKVLLPDEKNIGDIAELLDRDKRKAELWLKSLKQKKGVK